MAGSGSSQERLDQITRIIASNMVAEVCSIYVARAGETLELFSTEGLRPEAVHQTRLRFAEGLVGDIAVNQRPLNLPDAQSHPNFVYRPETGEEVYNSFLGVPILRSGQLIGVLCVQNRAGRHYEEEEAEVLQTVAMVLAEMIASGELIDQGEFFEAATLDDRPHRFDGVGLSDGVAIGRAVMRDPRVSIEKIVADDPEFEQARLEAAIADLRNSVEGMLSSSEMAPGAEHREILEAYRMFANDEGWIRRLREAVTSGLTAEAATDKVQSENRSRMERVADPYLRERLHDFDDLSNRLLRHLVDGAGAQSATNLPDDAILVARNMGPADLLEYDRSKIRGVVLEEGSPLSHVAIVARALDIPVVGRTENILVRVKAGDRMVVDGEMGQVFLRPADDILDAYGANLAIRAERQAQYVALRDEDSVTLDGEKVSLLMNAGLLVDLPNLDACGADGIGLFRTELQFMVSSTLPRLYVQAELYGKVLDAAGDRPVLFRTLDVGSDKVLPYLRQHKEDNPALGWRALRLTLDRPALLRYQIRALLIAASGRKLSFMFPMVADVAEFMAARAMLDKEMARFETLKWERPSKIELGAMLEVPSLIWQLDTLLPFVDFISIGSNDLMQFLFASDRNNPRLADRYDFLSPAVLSFLRDAVRTCDRHKVPVSLCGEMAGRPLEAMALIGLGMRRISMSPAAIGPVRMMLRSLNAGDLGQFMETMYASPDHSLRGGLEGFAGDHGVQL